MTSGYAAVVLSGSLLDLLLLRAGTGGYVERVKDAEWVPVYLSHIILTLLGERVRAALQGGC